MGYLQRIITGVQRVIGFALRTYLKLFQGKTLGVRAICLDPDNRIFLVRHSYVPGWHLPGGAIDNGMSAQEALIRELSEEGNLIVNGKPKLCQIYFNPKTSRRDHILLYAVHVTQIEAPNRNLEILEGRFFDFASLPDNLDPTTMQRISDHIVQEFQKDRW